MLIIKITKSLFLIEYKTLYLPILILNLSLLGSNILKFHFGNGFNFNKKMALIIFL